MCEDYRANATYDNDLDEADRAAGRTITCPVLVLWGRDDDLEELYDNPLAIWHDWAGDVRGRGLQCGHYLAEEASDETAAELRVLRRRALAGAARARRVAAVRNAEIWS